MGQPWLYEHIQVIHQELHHIVDIGKANMEMSIRLGKQMDDFQTTIQLPLDNIQGLIKTLHHVVNAGFEEIHFKEFRSLLNKINDAMSTPELLDGLLQLTNTLVSDYIVDMSQSRFHTGEFLFDPTIFYGLSAKSTSSNLFFSEFSDIDHAFMTHRDRYEQARRVSELFRQTHGDHHFLLGFLVSYAKVLLADDYREPHQITQLIQTIEQEKHKINDELKLCSEQKAYHLKHTLIKLDTELAELITKNVSTSYEKNVTEHEKKTNQQASKKLLEEKALLETKIAALSSEDSDFDKKILQLQYASVLQKSEDLALKIAISEQPPFQMIHLPIWTKGIKAYLRILNHPNMASIYKNPMRHFNQIIAMGENTRSTVMRLQKEPLLLKRLWKNYANALLFVSQYYHEQHTVASDDITYVREKLLNRAVKIGTDFDRYLLILQTQKTLLLAFCELLGAPAELKQKLTALPDQQTIHEQLNNLAIFNEPRSYALTVA